MTENAPRNVALEVERVVPLALFMSSCRIAAVVRPLRCRLTTVNTAGALSWSPVALHALMRATVGGIAAGPVGVPIAAWEITVALMNKYERVPVTTTPRLVHLAETGVSVFKACAVLRVADALVRVRRTPQLADRVEVTMPLVAVRMH